MTPVPENLAEYAIVTLDDGTKLDARQSAAIFLHAVEGLDTEKIATMVGYASAGSLRAFLRSDKGKRGVSVTITQHLSHGAAIGLRTMIKLAREAKSENVRQMAAADLLNRAGIVARDNGAQGPGLPAGGVNITFNLGSAQSESVTIEGEVIK